MSDVLVQPPMEGEGASALRRNTLGLRHAIVISVAVMSPAASVFFNTIPQAGLVGAAIPLCYLVGFVIALLVANQYSEFSREIPSSGSAYTFVLEGLGPIPGFLTAWVGLAAVVTGVPYSFVLLGANLQTLVLRWFGLNLHWSFWFVLAIGLAFAICYLGVRQSLNVDLTFLVFEIGVCLILAAIVLFHVGQQGGLSLVPFTLQTVPANGDITAGLILATLSYIGFETAAALGEETRDPHRNIPRAVFGSMLVVGIFYVLMAYVGTIGYGIPHMVNGFANDPAPFDTIGRLYGGPILIVLIDIVGLLSFFSAALAIINGGARILYTVGRDGLLPRWSTWLHPRRQNPIGTVIMLCALGLVIGLPLGFLFTPIQAFGFLGTLDAALVLIIYGLVSVASILFFWRKRRARFNVFLHALLPGLATLIIAGILAAVFISPSPWPLNLIPFVLGAWLILGFVLLFVLRKKLTTQIM
ncbi:amino acid permease [Ktedonobacter sp. SOSP1-52]|uniref:APC family permease n=1 Tax=Ktedonobacter sp. SOSP1-52 TaxID=2778366 RepID=UPI0019157AB7|nr:APC family permease [Ktedonobacter sp. SOSP1-52]GHO71007.1 amino acid permease [Ktedonobacter sp. SOSP1-52]